MQNLNNPFTGWWQPSRSVPDTKVAAIKQAILEVNRPLFVFDFNGRQAISQDGTITIERADGTPSWVAR